VIVPTVTPSLAVEMLRSLATAAEDFETILVDNGTGSAALESAAGQLDGAWVLRLDRNLGYGRAVNLAARRAAAGALVLLNDDSAVDPGYVERIAAALDPAAGVVMAAGVMRDAGAPELIETAGIELDRTLLAYDYLNGEPLSILQSDVPDPVGPTGAAAAFDRDAFLSAGGFDERLFAYLEDVDLVLRLRRDGGRCRLARDATGTHRHSGTLGPGSARKDYLAGFGRGYLLRKWKVLSPRRLPSVLVREVPQTVIQSIVDRNLGPVRGRMNGLRAAAPTEPYPPAGMLGDPPSLAAMAGRRWRRRARLRRRSD
jgi:N-acetylglucosaminyl-diphospho-decaprenol L-rhamnosyltransferase